MWLSPRSRSSSTAPGSLGFLDAGMNLSVVRLTGEIGYQGGKDQQLSTDFDDFDTTKGNFFAGLGLRVGF